ncbi:MAG: hypothetical protein IH859_01675 [Chloroflexi bacterium]|nr:hypothetical protein [Chloroflexota bacterium]
MSQDILVIESPISMIEGETISYSLTWQGASSLASPAALVYKDGADITSTAMPSGSHAVSGNVQTLKPLLAGGSDGRKKYVVIIECSVDGNTERRKLVVNIAKASAEV